MNEVTIYFGIDVSMDTFDVSTSDQKHFQFLNDSAKHAKLLGELSVYSSAFSA